MKLVLTVAVAFLFSQASFAKDVFPAQARLFAGGVNANPKDVNDEYTAQSLKKMENLWQYGVEITYPLARYLDVGMRYTRRMHTSDEKPSNTATDYEAELTQDAVLLLARLPIIKSKIIRIDGFAGIGGTNTWLKMKTSSLDGELSRRAVNDGLATPYGSYGASVAIGWDQFYIVFEGGFDQNKVGGLKTKGTMNGNIEAIDLSGGYFNVGILLDGVSASRK